MNMFEQTFKNIDDILHMKKLTDQYFATYISMLDIDIEEAFAPIKKKAWTAESFRFFTAVSVMSSSRIEGEQLEIDSYLKHKLQNIEYLPNLTEKPNDLFEAYDYKNLQAYYNSLERVGLFYDELNYAKSIPFLLMLHNALKQDQ